MSKVLALGVGNPLRGDDALGLLALQRVQENLQKRALTLTLDLNEIIFKDLGTDGLAVVALLSDFDGPVFILDTLNCGQKPGQLMAFKAESAKRKLKSDALSTHGFGLLDALKLIDDLEIKNDIYIFGTEALDISYKSGLSEPVKEHFELLCETVSECIICAMRSLPVCLPSTEDWQVLTTSEKDETSLPKMPN